MNAVSRFIAELHRRRVIKVTATYLVVSWLLIETSSLLFPALLLPEWAHRMVVLLAIIGLPVVIVLAWVFDVSPQGIERTSSIPASTEQSESQRDLDTALPPAADSALASICVMSFEALSADPEDKYLAQGVCAEIYSALAKLSGVRVISQMSTQLAGEGSDIRKLGARLNAQYVLSGSLRRQNENIRIIVSLSDTDTGSQIWSQTYKRVLDDVMEVEEEIAGAIVGAFGGEHLREQIKRANQGETSNATAWSLVHKARSYVLNYSSETLKQAESLAREALALDPDYAAAYATLADVLCEQVSNGLSDDEAPVLDEAVTAISAALDRTQDDPYVLKLAGNVWKLAGKHNDAIACLKRAVEISAYDLGAWGYLGGALAATDDPAQLSEAHSILDRILDMAPHHPGAGYWWHHKALAYTCQGNFNEAIKCAKKSVDNQSGLAWAWYLLANAASLSGDRAGAIKSLTQAQKANPNLTAQKFAALVRRTSATDAAARQRLNGLMQLNQNSVVS